jgi:hypothetical protein
VRTPCGTLIGTQVATQPSGGHTRVQMHQGNLLLNTVWPPVAVARSLRSIRAALAWHFVLSVRHISFRPLCNQVIDCPVLLMHLQGGNEAR